MHTIIQFQVLFLFGISNLFAHVTNDNEWTIIAPSIIIQNFWEEAWWFLSLRVLGLLSSSFYFHNISADISPGLLSNSGTFKLHPLLNPQGLPVLIPLAITVKYSNIITCLQSGLNLQPPDDYLLRSLGNQCL